MKSKTVVVEECMEEMFRRVGESYPNPELTKKDDWFLLRSWKKNDEQKFSEWMRKKIQKELKIPKTLAAREVGLFILNYGWTTKEP